MTWKKHIILQAPTLVVAVVTLLNYRPKMSSRIWRMHVVLLLTLVSRYVDMLFFLSAYRWDADLSKVNILSNTNVYFFKWIHCYLKCYLQAANLHYKITTVSFYVKPSFRKRGKQLIMDKNSLICTQTRFYDLGKYPTYFYCFFSFSLFFFTCFFVYKYFKNKIIRSCKAKPLNSLTNHS